MVGHAMLIAAALAPSNPRWEAGVATSYVVLRLRGSARLPAFGGSCTIEFGPAAFGMPLLSALGSTLDYRW
jgi:hypothetical protein